MWPWTLSLSPWVWLTAFHGFTQIQWIKAQYEKECPKRSKIHYMVFPNYTAGCRGVVNAVKTICICRCRLWWRCATWKYFKKTYQELQLVQSTLKTICKTKEFVLQENFWCSQGREMLGRTVGIWQGLLQIIKTHMCLMMETATISTVGEHSISTCLMGSVMLNGGFAHCWIYYSPITLARLFHLWTPAAR